jgi:predicted Zn-dependent protease
VPLHGAAGARQTPTAWKTFEHAAWGLALDYPADWSLDRDGDEVTFRSPNGATIVLGRAASDSRSEPAPGKRSTPQCTTTTTPHGVVATVCLDPASFARQAILVLKARGGRQQRLALRTHGRDAQIFDAMVASMRPISPPA